MSSVKKNNLPLAYRQEKYYYGSSWFQLMRPLTLSGTISPVLVGTGLAAMTGSVRIDIFIAIFVAAVLIQAATNMFNDYFDFLHGQDQEKWTTAQEVQSGHAPSHNAIPYVASFILAVAIGIGAWLASESSIWIILAGTAGIICGYLYSGGPRPLCSIGLGETVGAVFLGLVITVLAYVVQGNPLDIPILAVSFIFALLISSMILTNNIRDIEKDGQFRNTLATMLGKKRAVYVLTAILAIAYVWLLVMLSIGIVPWTSGTVFLAFPLAIRLLWSFRKGAKSREEMSGMKWAAYHHWAFGLLFAFGIWVGVL